MIQAEQHRQLYIWILYICPFQYTLLICRNRKKMETLLYEYKLIKALSVCSLPFCRLLLPSIGLRGAWQQPKWSHMCADLRRWNCAETPNNDLNYWLMWRLFGEWMLLNQSSKNKENKMSKTCHGDVLSNSKWIVFN